MEIGSVFISNTGLRVSKKLQAKANVYWYSIGTFTMVMGHRPCSTTLIKYSSCLFIALINKLSIPTTILEDQVTLEKVMVHITMWTVHGTQDWQSMKRTGSRIKCQNWGVTSTCMLVNKFCSQSLKNLSQTWFWYHVDLTQQSMTRLAGQNCVHWCTSIWRVNLWRSVQK